MNQHDINHEFWTVEEFADFLRVTVGAARAMIRRAQLPPDAVVRIGKRIRIRSAVIRKWLSQRIAA